VADALERPPLAEDLGDPLAQLLGVKGLYHHLGIDVPMAAAIGDAEAAGPKDRLGLVFAERKGGETRRVQLHRLAQRSERGVPVAGRQGGSELVGAGLRQRPSIRPQPLRQFAEQPLRPLGLPRRQFELAQTVEHRGDLRLFAGR
jgi:hypothetical protein